MTVDFAETSYLNEIARARTFGFMHEVEDLRDSGLALGGGLDNAVVLDEYRVLNSEGLRFADEFIRHKLLDAIGDLYLIGGPLLGAFSAHKSGHALNNKLVRAALADAAALEPVVFERAEETPAGVARLVSHTLNARLDARLGAGCPEDHRRRGRDRDCRRRGGMAFHRRPALAAPCRAALQVRGLRPCFRAASFCRGGTIPHSMTPRRARSRASASRAAEGARPS